jgi:hypothetical protein
MSTYRRFIESGTSDEPMKLIVKAPERLAKRISDKLHKYYGIKIEPSSQECEIYTWIQGMRLTICHFDQDWPFTNIMTIFFLKMKTGEWMMPLRQPGATGSKAGGR